LGISSVIRFAIRTGHFFPVDWSGLFIVHSIAPEGARTASRCCPMPVDPRVSPMVDGITIARSVSTETNVRRVFVVITLPEHNPMTLSTA
jgi:hypothetical protein